MSVRTAPANATVTTTQTAIQAEQRTTRRLLRCGLVAGPLFTAVATVQVLTRDGFDLTIHPISQLSTGSLGWIQITNFIVTGILIIAAAAGMRRVLRGGRAGTWGPGLFGAFGLGFVIAGAFVADPANGFPVGTPPGVPAEASWHSVVHGTGAALAFNALIVGCFFLARRFAVDHDRRWMIASIIVGVGLLVLLANPSAPGVTIRMAAGALIAFVYTTLLAAKLLRAHRMTGVG